MEEVHKPSDSKQVLELRECYITDALICSSF
jgi:hypothetical protein